MELLCCMVGKLLMWHCRQESPPRILSTFWWPCWRKVSICRMVGRHLMWHCTLDYLPCMLNIVELLCSSKERRFHTIDIAFLCYSKKAFSLHILNIFLIYRSISGVYHCIFDVCILWFLDYTLQIIRISSHKLHLRMNILNRFCKSHLYWNIFFF